GPVLTLLKTASAPILMRGGTGSFFLTVTNSGTGPTNASTLTATDPPPTGLPPPSATGSGWTCGISSQTVTCTRTDVLNAGANYTAIAIAVSVASTPAVSLTHT